MQQGTTDRTAFDPLRSKSTAASCGPSNSRAAHVLGWAIDHPSTHQPQHTQGNSRGKHTRTAQRSVVRATASPVCSRTLHATANLLSFGKSCTQCLLK